MPVSYKIETKEFLGDSSMLRQYAAVDHAIACNNVKAFVDALEVKFYGREKAANGSLKIYRVADKNLSSEDLLYFYKVALENRAHKVIEYLQERTRNTVICDDQFSQNFLRLTLQYPNYKQKLEVQIKNELYNLYQQLEVTDKPPEIVSFLVEYTRQTECYSWHTKRNICTHLIKNPDGASVFLSLDELGFTSLEDKIAVANILATSLDGPCPVGLTSALEDCIKSHPIESEKQQLLYGMYSAQSAHDIMARPLNTLLSRILKKEPAYFPRLLEFIQQELDPKSAFQLFEDIFVVQSRDKQRIANVPSNENAFRSLIQFIEVSDTPKDKTKILIDILSAEGQHPLSTSNLDLLAKMVSEIENHSVVASASEKPNSTLCSRTFLKMSLVKEINRLNTLSALEIETDSNRTMLGLLAKLQDPSLHPENPIFSIDDEAKILKTFLGISKSSTHDIINYMSEQVNFAPFTLLKKTFGKIKNERTDEGQATLIMCHIDSVAICKILNIIDESTVKENKADALFNFKIGENTLFDLPALTILGYHDLAKFCSRFNRSEQCFDIFKTQILNDIHSKKQLDYLQIALLLDFCCQQAPENPWEFLVKTLELKSQPANILMLFSDKNENHYDLFNFIQDYCPQEEIPNILSCLFSSNEMTTTPALELASGINKIILSLILKNNDIEDKDALLREIYLNESLSKQPWRQHLYNRLKDSIDHSNSLRILENINLLLDSGLIENKNKFITDILLFANDEDVILAHSLAACATNPQLLKFVFDIIQQVEDLSLRSNLVNTILRRQVCKDAPKGPKSPNAAEIYSSLSKPLFIDLIKQRIDAIQLISELKSQGTISLDNFVINLLHGTEEIPGILSTTDDQNLLMQVLEKFAAVNLAPSSSTELEKLLALDVFEPPARQNSIVNSMPFLSVYLMDLCDDSINSERFLETLNNSIGAYLCIIKAPDTLARKLCLIDPQLIELKKLKLAHPNFLRGSINSNPWLANDPQKLRELKYSTVRNTLEEFICDFTKNAEILENVIGSLLKDEKYLSAFGHENLSEIGDFLEAYYSSVILPSNIEYLDLLHQNQIFENERITTLREDFIVEFSKRYNIEDIIKFSARWHANFYPPELFPLRSTERLWHPILLETIKVDGYTLEACRSTSELVRQSQILGHCVGQGNYDQRCCEAKSHILLLSKAEDPRVTIEVTYRNEKFTIQQKEGRLLDGSRKPLPEESLAIDKALAIARQNPERYISKVFGETVFSKRQRKSSFEFMENEIGYAVTHPLERARMLHRVEHEYWKEIIGIMPGWSFATNETKSLA